MKNQDITKWGKAGLALATALGIGIEPEHLEQIAMGATGVYGLITAVEAWRKGRKEKAK